MSSIISTFFELATKTESESFSMCVTSQGEYGVDPGLIFSFPCVSMGGKVRVVEGLQFNDYGKAKIQATLEELRQERDMIKSLGLLE